jgi:hypothetical protein
MRLTLDVLKKMVRSIATTRDEELGCEDCFEELDQFAELKLKDKNAAEALPLVQQHLSRCGNCREEFEAFMEAIKATDSQKPINLEGRE